MNTCNDNTKYPQRNDNKNIKNPNNIQETGLLKAAQNTEDIHTKIYTKHDVKVKGSLKIGSFSNITFTILVNSDSPTSLSSSLSLSVSLCAPLQKKQTFSKQFNINN